MERRNVVNPSIKCIGLLLIVLTLTGCKSAYYGMWETMGKQKRDLLVDRVEDARESQTAAKEQFKDALERFRSVVGPATGKAHDLQTKYDQLKAELDGSEARAKDVSKRITDVKGVSADLFKEWQKELAQYNSADLRRRSETQLHATQRRYDQLIATMERAESSMQPVLRVFRDQALFLKHNLNAQAIASLQDVAAGLDADTMRLIQDMERSVDEADAFIKAMGTDEAK